MAPVQTFGSSPITAAKAPTATAQPDQSHQTAPASTAATQSSTSPSRYGPPPPAAQPGSRLSNPTAPVTLSSPAAAMSTAGIYPQPTPTRPIQDNASPPAPQAGAVPRPPGAATSTTALPPPPKTGEKLGPQHTGSVPVATAPLVAAPEGGYPLPTTVMPAQMAYPPPEASHSIRGTSTSTTTQPSPYAPALGPVQLPVGGIGGTINQATDMSHPPGYQQDVHAAEFSSGQRAAHNAYVTENSSNYPGFSNSVGGGGGGGYGGSSGGDNYEDDESLWNTAKKWASAAGSSLAAAESEVWKAVNKDQK